MTQSISAALWVLITVTNAGEVHQEGGFTSLPLCEDAISIAKYGLTVFEHEADVKAEKIARESVRKEREDKWRAAHPPREPKTDHEKEMVKSPLVLSSCSHVKDGMIYDDDCSLSSSSSWSTLERINGNEIKFARCLQNPSETGEKPR